MKCEDCKKFDQETKEMVLKVFGPDELASIAANFIQVNHSARDSLRFLNPNNGTPQNLRARVHCQTQIDFTSRVIGKCLVALEDETVKEIEESLAKRGIRFKIQHEACPHGQEIGAPCNRDACKGTIEFEMNGECTCHVGNAPCPTCSLSKGLYCADCGWEA